MNTGKWSMIVDRVTWRFLFGNKTTAMNKRIRHRLRVGFWMSEICELILQLTILLPSEGWAEERERFPSSGGRLEQCVAMAVLLSSLEGGDDPAHERKLRPIRLVRELHLDTSDVVCIFRVSCRSCSSHFRLLR